MRILATILSVLVAVSSATAFAASPIAASGSASSNAAHLAESTAKEGAKTKVIPYPLDTCLVTDNKLGSMGDPVTIERDGRELKFCCKPCVDKFEKDPAKYLGKLSK